MANLLRSLLVALIVCGLAVSPLGAQSPATDDAVLRPVAVSTAFQQLSTGRADSATVIVTGADAELHLHRGDRHLVADMTGTLVPEAVAAARQGGVPLVVERATVASDLGPVDAGGGGFSIGEWVQTWGPMLLLGALVLVSALALRTVGGGRFRQRLRPVESTTGFDDVAGIDEIRDDVAEIADVLRDPGPYERLGAQLPKGVILHGPPGTGKTLLARAVAGEAGVPFFSASGSEFVEMYAGLGSRRIRSLFAAARKAAPAVVYIDEIDAVGSRRTGHAANGEREQTLDQLLTEMDGFRTDPTRPVVVLASTNRLDELDPALVRSGRFDRKIAVGLPSRGARREILEVHLRERPLAPSADAGRVAAITVGLAGADLAALCNEAAFEAARAGEQAIDMAHFRRALLRLAAGPERRSHVMSDDERRLVAYHEMGHALVGHLSASCDQVDRVTVIPQGGALGVTISLPMEDRFLVTRTECTERLAMMLAGRAAEELVFGECTSGAADDLERASRLARSMAGRLAMAVPGTRESLLVGIPDERPEQRADEVERAAQELLGEAFLTATEMLREHRELLERGAAVLLEREALDHDEIVALFGDRPDQERLAPLSGSTDA